MAIFSGESFEKGLEKTYVTFLINYLGWNPSQAKKEVKRAIKQCKTQSHEEGTSKMQGDFGELLIEHMKDLPPGPKRIIERATKDGATYEDIKEWWNMHDLGRRMVVWSENVFRYASYLHLIEDEELSGDDAMNRVRLMLPFYGHPDEDKGNVSGDDRRLPSELRGRVDRYREKWGARHISEKVKKYSSYNAFIRDEIRKGNL